MGARFLVAVTQPPAWKRTAPQNSAAFLPRALSQISLYPRATGSGVGTKDSRAGPGHRPACSDAPCGGRALWRLRQAGHTSYLYSGLQFPRQPAGVGAGGGARHVETLGGGRGVGGLSSLKAREPSPERRLRAQEQARLTAD